MALCIQADVEARLPVTFTINPEPVVTALIDGATGHIEREYGGPVEAGAYTERHTGRGRVILRHYPVTDVTAMMVDGTALDVTVDIAWDPAGIIGPLAGGYPSYWSTVKTNAIEVTYNAGFDPVPADIVDVCAQMVANSMKQNGMFGAEAEGAQGIVREELGDYGVQYSDALANPAAYVHMTGEQRDVIRYYRMPVLA